MRILMIGGTAFVGRYITQAAIDAGHDVTLFHRGQTGGDLFPAATHLTGDRNDDLSALASGTFDATIDVCAFFPRQVAGLARALDGRGGRYVYISSVSVYKAPLEFGYDESAPLADCPDPDAAEVTAQNYGGLKVACEQVATELFGPETTIIRPTYVIGPHDRSYRFTWWVDRIARGGNVLAPGDPGAPMQLIDARDQGTWTIRLLDESITGTFHTVSPEPQLGFGEMLETIAAEVAPAGTRLTWVDSEFLLAQGLDGAIVPLWDEGDEKEATAMLASPAAAFATGLHPRPLRQTIADIRAEDRVPGTGRAGVGVPPEKEAEVLAKWAGRAG
jgi:2'-hydroxyisoflavone reductase